MGEDLEFINPVRSLDVVIIFVATVKSVDRGVKELLTLLGTIYRLH